jgi:autotransporter-associated beta strand protein
MEDHVTANAGQLTVAGGRTFAPGRPFDNSGLLTVAAGGIVNLGQGGVNTGTVHTEFGAELTFGGGYTHAAGSIVSGDALITFADGVNVIEGAFVGAFALTFAGGTTRVAAGGSLSPGSFTISGGANVVEAGGTINVGAGGLTFTGGDSPSLVLAASAANPGRLRLDGDVTAAISAGTAGLLTGAGKVGDQPGAIDLMGGMRSFTVSDGTDGVDLSVSARITNGSLRKAGPGLLRLTHLNNTYAGQTLIANGTLEVTESGALGPAEVVFTGGTLSLRSDLINAAWNNDLRGAGDADGVSVHVGRMTAAGGGAGTFEVRGLRIGAATLRVTGADRSLRFTGAAQLAGNATIDNDVPVEFADAVRQSGGTFGLTKNGPGTLTFSGVLPNQYAGATRVQNGLLLLNKAGGAPAVAGDLEIFGGTVRLLNGEQVADTAALRMGNASALLDLNGRTETVATANLTAGATVAGPGQLNVAGSLLAPGGVVLARAGGVTRISAGAVNNTGTFEARDGGTLLIEDALTRLANYQPATATLQGGAWRIIGNSAIRVDGVAINRLAAGLVLDGLDAKLLRDEAAAPQSDALAGLSSIAAGGSLTLRNGRAFTPPAGPFSSEGTLRVGPGSRFTAAGPVNITGELEVEAGGSVDLKEHALVYRATLATRDALLAQMNEAVRSARNGTSLWQGPGITSSSLPGGGELALGVALNERGITSFGGIPADANSVLIGMTLLGDADLSGGINAADYSLIDRGRALRKTGWYFGDFDYSGGPASGDDLMLMDRAFLDQQDGGLGLSAPARVVPEPGTLAAVALTALALGRRIHTGDPCPPRRR